MKDKIFKSFLIFSVILFLFLFILMIFSLFKESFPAIKNNFFDFFTKTTWDPNNNLFSAIPFIIGTIITSFLALIICMPFSIAISFFLSEYVNKEVIKTIIQTCIELLAGIPSVIYGLWGYFVLLNPVRTLEIKLGVPPYGVGIFSASLILSIMIIPYFSTISREVFHMCPKDIKEAAYSLGATKFEVLTRIVFPFGRSGVVAGFFLSLGRALGETMAVTMLIGNSNFVPLSIFSPANTMASVIANEFAESTGNLHSSNLIFMALILFLITAIFNLAGKIFIKKATNLTN